MTLEEPTPVVPGTGALDSSRQTLMLGAACCAALGVITIGSVGRKVLLLPLHASDLTRPLARAVGDPLALSLVWVGLLLIATIGIRRGRQAALWGIKVMATLNLMQLLWYLSKSDLLGSYGEYSAYPVRMSFLVAESGMLIVAGNLPALIHWWKDWRKPELTPLLRLWVLLSATLWAIVVRVWVIALFDHRTGFAGLLHLSWSILPALPFLFLALRFLWAPRSSPTDARLTRFAGWLSLVSLVLILITPIGYGLVIIYLLMFPAGLFALAALLMATVGLLKAGAFLRDRSQTQPGPVSPQDIAAE